MKGAVAQPYDIYDCIELSHNQKDSTEHAPPRRRGDVVVCGLESISLQVYLWFSAIYSQFVCLF